MYRIHTVKLGDDHFIKVARIVPTMESPLGVFAPLEGTVYARAIYRVTGVALSHALHGYSKPLMEQLSRPPTTWASLFDTSCAEALECNRWNPKVCVAAHKSCPTCFTPEAVQDKKEAIQVLSRLLTDKVFPILVEGPEHSLI